MLEVFRYYFSHGGRHFVIVIFKSADSYIAKIFENKKIIREFTATVSHEMVEDMKFYSPVNPFQEMIDAAMDWVKNNISA